MISCLSTIVVPVDFSTHTDAALGKVMELSSAGTLVQLLYVKTPSKIPGWFRLPVLAKFFGFPEQEKEDWCPKLLRLKRTITAACPEVQVSIAVMKDIPPKNAILETATRTQADLIILGIRSTAVWRALVAQPAQRSRDVPCAIVTVAPGAPARTIKTVVVPITKQVIYSSIKIIAALAKGGKLNIHLVTFTGAESHTTSTDPSLVPRIYHWLKATVPCQVQYSTLPAFDKARELWHYASSVNADMVLMGTAMQQKAGWWKKNIAALLQPGCNVSVLAVQPTAVPIHS